MLVMLMMLVTLVMLVMLLVMLVMLVMMLMMLVMMMLMTLTMLMMMLMMMTMLMTMLMMMMARAVSVCCRSRKSQAVWLSGQPCHSPHHRISCGQAAATVTATGQVSRCHIHRDLCM
jgi:hypothetical protein